MPNKIVKASPSENLPERQDQQLFLPTELDFTFQQLLNSYIKNGLVLKIGAIPFAIWIILRAHVRVSGKDAGKVFLSYGAIRKISGFGVNTIRTSIKTLEKEGLISVVEESKGTTAVKRYYTVEFLVSESDNSKKIAIPYLPAKAKELRDQTQNFIQGRGDIPDGVTIYQDNRQVKIINNVIVVTDPEQAKKIVDKIREKEERDKEVVTRWITNPDILRMIEDPDKEK